MRTLVALLILASALSALLVQLPKPSGSGGGGSGSGNSTTTGAFASNPGTCTNGDVRFPSDSFYLLRCASNVWVPWGMIVPMTVPSTGTRSWDNQGGATETTTSGAFVLRAPAATGANLRVRHWTAPATPYTRTFHFIPGINAVDTNCAGVGWRDNDDGKILVLRICYASAVVASTHTVLLTKYTSSTVFSASYTLDLTAATFLNVGYHGSQLCAVKLEDDNTNLKVYWSFNSGNTFELLHTVGRTDFMTGGPTDLLYYAESGNANYPATNTLVSYQ